MTTITKPIAVLFQHVGNIGLAAAFRNACLEAGMVAGGVSSPYFTLAVAAWDGVPGDRPTWFGVGDDNLIIAPWAGDAEIFNPYSTVLSDTDNVICTINGITGSWWIMVNGFLRMVGTRIRRFPADMHDGIFPRFVIVDFSNPAQPSWKGVFMDGTSNPATTFSWVSHGFFSPIWRPGEDTNPFGITPGARVEDTLPPMMAPLFPVVGYGGPLLPAFWMGDCLDLMAATDGFLPEAQPVPGWIVLPVREGGPNFAVPLHPDLA